MASAKARWASLCSTSKWVVRYLREYCRESGMKTDAKSQVSYDGLFSEMPLLAKNPMSNWILWPMIGSAPRKSSTSDATEEKNGARLTW